MRGFSVTWCFVALVACALPSTAAGQAADAPLTLQQAIALAKQNSQDFLVATGAAALAKEDRMQARGALLPTAGGFSQYIRTQPNGTASGIFVPNDGPNIYTMWATVHGDLFSPTKWADYRAAAATEAAARAEADVAARGLVVTVVQDYYELVAAVRKSANAGQGLSEAQQFLKITRQQEQAGEVAHSDVVKAQIEVSARERDQQDAELSELKSRLAVSVLIYPDFRDNFTVADDLVDAPPLPPLDTVRAQANENSPELKAAEASLREQSLGVTSARSEYLPSLSFDYFYGIDANQFAVYDPDHRRLLGSVVQAQATVPLWNWGATQSKVRQAQIREKEARGELSLAQRQLLANLSSFYSEAQTSGRQVDSLRSSLDLATESLRLTLLRYQAGEVSVLEVVDAQTTLIDARNAYNDGLVRYRVALAALQTPTGTL
jgi:outer membrane protein TolC